MGLDAFKVTELDAWNCRDAFLSIPENDNDKLLQFLETVGQWSRSEGDITRHWSQEVQRHISDGNPTPLSVAGLWIFQRSLKQALLNKSAFKKMYAPLTARPKTGVELLQEGHQGVAFPLRFEITDVPFGVLTLTCAYDALLATVFFDVARGLKFKVCSRKDCGKPFPITSDHAKWFCSQYCGHLVSQRNKREMEKKKRQAEKERANKR
jgi:hypothetical protein